jgi:ubiquinone/menaquinone biosynthesis C-methylase UbiE
MKLIPLNDAQYLKKQYKDASNIDARIRLHQRFSVHKYGWQLWVFDHFNLPANCRILELGCGPGNLWLENIDRIPPGWDITLSDFSTGMLEKTLQSLKKQHPFQYKAIDAQYIPYESGSFDAVIANHMLYHVSDRRAALAEIRRVLKPSGQFYAATGGGEHLMELAALIGKFNQEPAAWDSFLGSFTVENGMDQLSPWFTNIKLYCFDNCLEVTEAEALVDYVFSGRPRVKPERHEEFRQFVEAELESHGGVFHITTEAGLFVCVPKGDAK